jgi:hypothetical protein
VGEAGVLNAIVSWVKAENEKQSPSTQEDPELILQVGGLAKGTHYDWTGVSSLAVGDEVAVRIIQTETPDVPVGSERMDDRVREAEERKYYARLRAKYGRSLGTRMLSWLRGRGAA